jgi:hypothetical protein
MSRRSRVSKLSGAAAVVVAVAIAAWWGVDRVRSGASATAREPAPGPSGAPAAHAGGGAAPVVHGGRSGAAPPELARDDDVTVTGKVIDAGQQHGVAGVEVVFRGATGENTTMTGRDGAYSIRVAAGAYRAFVRDDTVLSIGRPDLVRLPTLPSAETAGIPDEALMATVMARGDVDGVDLSVVRGGMVNGRVVDRAGRPVAGAVLRARGNTMRPTLATDVAESNAGGAFELRLPAGSFTLDVSHPRFAGIETAAEARLAVEPGGHLRTTITLVAGCVIAGRVVGPDGKPASDGAIEKRWGDGAADFTPAGRIDPDGRFRWVTTDEVDVTLRAWPWKAPPSPGRRFSCRDGARFEDVVFQLPERRPDIEGVLVDKAGESVAFAFVDLAPLDPGGIAQQERTDARGHWEVYSMPPGRYRVSAQAEGRGVAVATIVSPRDGVRLELGGTGRIEGTTTRLTAGSFELVGGACGEGPTMVPVPQSRRLVTVRGGRFTVDDLPACELTFGVSWRGKLTQQRMTIPSGGTAHLELDLGPPRAKTVRGVVRDGAGEPVARATVTASYQGKADAVVRTDAAGAFTVKTYSGATIRVTTPGRVGYAQVGAANVDAEQVDVVIGDDADDETEN